MPTFVTAVVVFICLVIALLLGAFARRYLAAQHLDGESKDTVKIALGLVATMAALLLGLLVSSAQGDYDAQRTQVIEMAAKIATLDRMLELYGPEAAGARAQFRAIVESAVRKAWPEGRDADSDLSADASAGDAAYISFQALAPRNESQATLKAQATALLTDLAERRALLIAQSASGVAAPLLVVVVCWLFVIEFGFSLLAPPSALATGALLVSAAAVSGAILLLLELQRPFDGLIRIPSAPLLNALGIAGG